MLLLSDLAALNNDKLSFETIGLKLAQPKLGRKFLRN